MVDNHSKDYWSVRNVYACIQSQNKPKVNANIFEKYNQFQRKPGRLQPSLDCKKRFEREDRQCIGICWNRSLQSKLFSVWTVSLFSSNSSLEVEKDNKRIQPHDKRAGSKPDKTNSNWLLQAEKRGRIHEENKNWKQYFRYLSTQLEPKHNYLKHIKNYLYSGWCLRAPS